MARSDGHESPPTAPARSGLEQPRHPGPRPPPRHGRHAANHHAADRARRGGHRVDAAGRRAAGCGAGDRHVPDGRGAGVGHGAEHVCVLLSRVRAADACVWEGGGREDVCGERDRAAGGRAA